MKSNQNSGTCPTIEQIDPQELRPSPENEKVYATINHDDPALQKLAEDLEQRGVLEPLVISSDGYILSGHRRREAAILAGLETVPCRRVEVRRGDREFVKLLVSYNNQRVKDRPEQLREAVIRVSPQEAYQQLIDYREKQCETNTEFMQVEAAAKRKKITKVKMEMAAAIKKVVYARQKFWPLSDRQVHYMMLNDPPLRNTDDGEKSRYHNAEKCYKDVCDMLTRMRFANLLPMFSIGDSTRPSIVWNVHSNASSFMQKELDDFMQNYRCDLQNSQPVHLQVVAEKLTVENTIRPVCLRYNIPYMIGRGYTSVAPRNEIYQNFKETGKQKMYLLILSDFDPEGINIGESLLKSLKDEFGLGDRIKGIRVGLNRKHIQQFGLKSDARAKKSSSRYKQFVRKHGTAVFELEALEPEQLQQLLRNAIDSILDLEAFNDELDQERQDAQYLRGVRQEVCDFMQSIG